MHASTYGAVLHYLRAVEVVGSDYGASVGAQMRATPASDPLFNGSRIREDGRVLSPLFLMRDKQVSQVRGPNDWAEVIATVSPEQAYRPLFEGGCALVKS
jgi:branched-chain amino acid transport system substrate-binding protein